MFKHVILIKTENNTAGNRAEVRDSWLHRVPLMAAHGSSAAPHPAGLVMTHTAAQPYAELVIVVVVATPVLVLHLSQHQRKQGCAYCKALYR
jgi:hypothetical protein